LESYFISLNDSINDIKNRIILRLITAKTHICVASTGRVLSSERTYASLALKGNKLNVRLADPTNNKVPNSIELLIVHLICYAWVKERKRTVL